MEKALPIYKMNINEARNKMEQGAKNHIIESVERIEQLVIPFLDYKINAKLYIPKEADDSLIIYFHGGAYTLNSINTHDFLFRKLANSTKHKVLGIDFRLSPEYKFPIPLLDCITSIIWSYNNNNLLKINKNEIYVGGDSSGATLALSSALYLRDINLNYIKKLFLLYPPLDNYEPGTKSYFEKGYSYPVSRDFLIWGWNNYLTNKQKLNNEYIFPLQTDSYKGLPQLSIMYCGLDALYDEDLAFINRLKAENIDFEYKCFENEMHGFMMNDKGDAFKDAINRLIKFLK